MWIGDNLNGPDKSMTFKIEILVLKNNCKNQCPLLQNIFNQIQSMVFIQHNLLNQQEELLLRMIVFPSILMPLKLQMVNYYQTNQSMISSHNSFKKESQDSVSAKESDPRQAKGTTYQIQVMKLLKTNDLLSMNITNKKFSYPAGDKFLENIELISNHETSTQQELQAIKNFCQTFTKTKNHNHEVEVEYDIFPHYRENQPYEQVMKQFLTVSAKGNLIFFQDIFQLNLKPDKALYVGQIKSNFFNQNQILKCNFPQSLDKNQKVALYRTAEIVRKVCMTRKHEWILQKNILDDNFFSSVSRINDLIKKNEIKQLGSWIQEIEEKTICFFIIIQSTLEVKSHQNFLEKLGEKNVNFLKKFSKNFKVIFHLIIDNSERQSTREQKSEQKLKIFIKNEINELKKEMDDKFDKKFKEIDDKFERVIQQLSQIKKKI